MQSLPITTDVVSSNLDQGEVNLIKIRYTHLLPITDTGKTVVNQVQPGLFWIGAVAVYSPWMDYLGKYGFFFCLKL
jgi:hypothetical protein